MNEIPNKDKEIGFWYIVGHEKGYIDDLNRINPGLGEYFSESGTIRIETNDEGRKTFRLCGCDMDADGSLCGPKGEDGSKYLIK